MVTISYFLLILLTMPFFIKDEDWCLMACIMYIGCCILFTLPFGILFYKFVLKG